MKLFNKVAAIAVGVTLAAGVGAGIALSNREYVKAEAASTATVSISERASTLNWSNGVAQSGWKDTSGIFTFTQTGGGNNGKYYSSDSSWRFYNGGTVGISCSTSYEIISVSSTPSNTFSISSDKHSASCALTATVKFTAFTISYQTSGSNVSVTGVTLSSNSESLTVGETTTLTATVAPSNATNKNVSWSSSNEDVATVSDGTITALDAGSTTITVTTEDGEKTATCAVTVSLPTVADEINVADALTIINGLSNGAISTSYYKVTGYVVSVESYNSTYKNIEFTIADTKGGSPVLTCYRVKCTSAFAETILVNAKITLTGKLQKFVKNSTVTPELVGSIESQLSILEAGEIISIVDDGDSFEVYYGTSGNEIYFTGVNSSNVGTYSDDESDAIVFTAIESATSGQFALSFDGKFLSYSGSDNKVYTSTTNNSNATLWTLTNNGTYDVIESVNVAGRYLKYNAASGQERFCCYASSSNIFIKKIIVADPTTLTMDTVALTLEQGETSDPLTFTTDSPDAIFHWVSEDETKATVVNGAVTAVASSGTVKIYVYFDANGNGQLDLGTDLSAYCTVTLTLPVVDYSSVTYGGVGTLITSSNASTLIANNKKIVLAYNESEAVAGSLTSGYLKAETNSENLPITFSNGNATLTIGDGTKEVAIMVLTLEANGGNFYLKMKSGKYLGFAASAGGNLSEQTSKDGYEWEVTYEGITAVSENENFLQYNSGSPRFKTYKSTSNMKAIQLYSFNEYVDEAETYASNFMNSGLCGANDNTKASSSIWLQQKSAFEAISAGAQNVLKSAQANVSASASSIQQCLARYDRVIYLHYGSEASSYPDFMSRVANHYVTPMSNARAIIGYESDTAATVVVVITAMVSITAVGGFFLLKRKPF